MRYRSEIDGLRALAIVPVVLFHAGFSGFSGGFVGVDVFFVISGYLITLAIVAEHADGRFSLLRFYERRASRILPALFAVLAACLPFAWLWLAPADMQDFAISVAGVVTFTTNILAARFINYFGPSAEITPLVHFWSLAVEEQFYLIFPLFALIALRFGKSAFIALAVIIGIASFVWGHSFANRGVEGVFYWSTARAWELLIGVIAALLPAAKSGATAKSAFGLLGIGLIVFSILTLDGSTPFPAANRGGFERAQCSCWNRWSAAAQSFRLHQDRPDQLQRLSLAPTDPRLLSPALWHRHTRHRRCCGLGHFWPGAAELGLC